MIFFLLFLAAGSGVMVTPATPTVGDLITLQFPLPADHVLTLDPSEEYELVEIDGTRAVIRSFRPGPLTVVARTAREGEEPRAYSAQIEIASVLAPNDSLEPAPLAPAQPLPGERLPWLVIGGAGVAAAMAWIALLLAVRRRGEERPVAELPPDEAFERELARIRALHDPAAQWIALGEATRSFFARTRPELGRELTSREMVEVMHARRVDGTTATQVERVLRSADRTKFSTLGPPSLPVTSAIEEMAKLSRSRNAEEKTA